MIAQAMMLSLATYVLHHVTVSNSFLTKWQQIIDSYITGSYKGCIGRRRLQARWIITDMEQGGLGGPNLKAFVQMLQLKRFPFWRMFSGNQYPNDLVKIYCELNVENEHKSQLMLLLLQRDKVKGTKLLNKTTKWTFKLWHHIKPSIQ